MSGNGCVTMSPWQPERGGHRDGVWAPGRRALTLGLVLMITLVGFEALAITTVMPKMKDDLGGIGWYGWVFRAFFLGNLLGIVPAGHAPTTTARPDRSSSASCCSPSD